MDEIQWRRGHKYLTLVYQIDQGMKRLLRISQDRFHIMQKLNKAIDEVRASEARRLQQDGYEPVLKHSRWCLLKRRDNLTDKQALKISELLKYNLQSVRSYLMREDFQRFWEYHSPAWAQKFLDERWRRAGDVLGRIARESIDQARAEASVFNQSTVIDEATPA